MLAYVIQQLIIGPVACLLGVRVVSYVIQVDSSLTMPGGAIWAFLIVRSVRRTYGPFTLLRNGGSLAKPKTEA